MMINEINYNTSKKIVPYGMTSFIFLEDPTNITVILQITDETTFRTISNSVLSGHSEDENYPCYKKRQFSLFTSFISAAGIFYKTAIGSVYLC